MAEGKRNILVCINVDCKRRGSEAVLEEFRTQTAGAEDIEITAYPCFGGCEYGPNVVLHPLKTFYSGVTAADVPAIRAHLDGGPPVERLTGQVDAMTEELIFELLDAGLM